MFTVLHHPVPGPRVSNLAAARLAGPVAAPSPAAGSAPAAAACARKGVAAWNFTGARKALRLSGASWFYTWAAGPNGISAPPGAGFVPMIWGAGERDQPETSRQARRARPSCSPSTSRTWPSRPT